MREATGELNMTVVVVVAVGVLAAFFYTTIWPLIRGNLDSKSRCSDAICDPNKVTPDGMATCNYNGTEFQCPWKG